MWLRAELPRSGRFYGDREAFDLFSAMLHPSPKRRPEVTLAAWVGAVNAGAATVPVTVPKTVELRPYEPVRNPSGCASTADS